MWNRLRAHTASAGGSCTQDGGDGGDCGDGADGQEDACGDGWDGWEAMRAAVQKGGRQSQ